MPSARRTLIRVTRLIHRRWDRLGRPRASPEWMSDWRASADERPYRIPDPIRSADPDRAWLLGKEPSMNGADLKAWPGFLTASLVLLFRTLGATQVPAIALHLARRHGPALAWIKTCRALDHPNGRRASQREIVKAIDRMCWIDGDRFGLSWVDPTSLYSQLLIGPETRLQRDWRRLKRDHLVRFLTSESETVLEKLKSLSNPDSARNQ